MDAHSWGGSGRGRSPELLPPARGRRFHSAPAGIPQAQRGSGFGGPVHRPGITEGGRYDLNHPNQRFDSGYYPEDHEEEYEEEYRDDQFYDAESEQRWPPEATYPYPMEEYSQQQDHTEPVPPSKTSAYKSNNPFARFAAGTGS